MICLSSPLEVVDALADAAAVDFEPRLAGAARADAAAQARHRRALAGQPRQAVFHLRQLHLQLAFRGLRALREDVQNQRRSVDHAHAQRVFEVALLRAGQLVVDDGEVDLQRLAVERQLLGLAAADVGRRIRARALLQHAGDDHRAGGLGQTGELLEGVVRVGGDQHDLLGLLDDAAALDGLADAILGQLDLAHPRLLRHAAGLDGAVDGDGEVVVLHLAQEGRADAGAAGVLHADGAHRIEPEQPQRLQVDVGQPSVPARMRVDAAVAGQAVEVAAQVQFRQRDRADGADGDFEHLAVSVEVDQHLAVDLVGVADQDAEQPVGEELVALEARVVELFQLVEHALADAKGISVNHGTS